MSFLHDTNIISSSLQEAEVEEARLVAKRALETINYREEGEKINVWVSTNDVPYKQHGFFELMPFKSLCGKLTILYL